MNDKETGSFYTPKELIEYMVTYTSARIKPKTILEPSAGDGRFVEPLKKFNAQILVLPATGKRELNGPLKILL